MAGGKVADIFVSLNLEMAEYMAGLKSAEAEAKTTGARIRAAFGKSAFGGFVDDLRLGGSMTASLGRLFKDLAKDIANLPTKALHAAFSGIKTVVMGIGGALKDVGKGILQGVGIGAGFGLIEMVSRLVSAIPDLISKGREYGQVVADVTQITGTTGEKASEFVGILTQMDAPLNNIVSILAQFQRNIDSPLVQKTAKEIGVAFTDSNGVMLSAIDILENYRQAVEKLGISALTMNAVQQAFGRGGIKVFDDYIRMATADINKLRMNAHELGLVMSTEQAQLAENMKWAGKQMELSLTGVGVALYEALGPSVIALFDAASRVIVENKDKIVEALGSIAATVVGFVSTLFGANDGMNAFVNTLNSVVKVMSPLEAQIRGYSAEIADLDANNDGLVDSEQGVADATGASTAAIDKQVEALRELERQQERTYKKALDSLNEQLDAQLAILDAEDKQRQMAKEDADNLNALKDAQIALAEARGQAREDRMLGKIDREDDNLLRIAEAEGKVLDAQQAIEETKRRRAEDKRRAEIQSVKDFIGEVDKIVSDASSSPAAAKEDLATLAGREKALREAGAGTAADGSDMAIKLKAVLEAEKRVREVQANAIAQADLDADRARLTSATKTSKSIKQTRLDDLIALRDKLIEEENRQKAALVELEKRYRKFGEVIGGDADGSLPSWLKKATASGEEFATKLKGFFESIKPAIEGVTGAIGGLISSLNDPGTRMILAALAGAAIGGPAGAAIFAIVAGLTTPEYGTGMGYATNPNYRGMVDNAAESQGAGWFGIAGEVLMGVLQQFSPSINLLNLINGLKPPTKTPSGPARTWADGGRPEPGWNLVGERGPELLYSSGNEYVLNNRASAALARLNAGFGLQPALATAGVGGDPAIIRVEVGGQRLVDYLDRQLLYRRRR